MKSKLFVMTMTVVMSCSLLALAQMKKSDTQARQIDPKPPVIQVMPKIMLTCTPGAGKDVSTPLYVKNPTGQDLPAGTLINWTATQKGTAKGKQTLTEALKKNSGNQVSLLGPADNVASCQAWAYKK
jgi:hypothetical protein